MMCFAEQLLVFLEGGACISVLPSFSESHQLALLYYFLFLLLPSPLSSTLLLRISGRSPSSESLPVVNSLLPSINIESEYGRHSRHLIIVSRTSVLPYGYILHNLVAGKKSCLQKTQLALKGQLYSTLTICNLKLTCTSIIQNMEHKNVCCVSTKCFWRGDWRLKKNLFNLFHHDFATDKIISTIGRVYCVF